MSSRQYFCPVPPGVNISGRVGPYVETDPVHIVRGKCWQKGRRSPLRPALQCLPVRIVSFVIYPDSLQKGDREQMLSLSGKFAGGSRVSG